jgi:hypothetical protein
MNAQTSAQTGGGTSVRPLQYSHSRLWWDFQPNPPTDSTSLHLPQGMNRLVHTKGIGKVISSPQRGAEKKAPDS